MIQEISELPDGGDVEKWFVDRQSLSPLVYFLRRCEHSFESTIDAISKDVTSASMDALVDAFHNDVEGIVTPIVVKLIKESVNRSKGTPTLMMNILSKLTSFRIQKGDNEQGHSPVVGLLTDSPVERTSKVKRRQDRIENLQKVIEIEAFQLADMFKHPDSDVREAAMRTLGQLAQYYWLKEAIRDAILELVDMFKDSHSNVFAVAATTLDQLAQHGEE
ncbi:hypothetical protein CPB86DRAFT_269268 [Serendipita vermifera]|nr:hypothetical protein CPB86DRAFT_269268 [Serendipita vermifera]